MAPQHDNSGQKANEQGHPNKYDAFKSMYGNAQNQSLKTPGKDIKNVLLSQHSSTDSFLVGNKSKTQDRKQASRGGRDVEQMPHRIHGGSPEVEKGSQMIRGSPGSRGF